MQRSAAFDVDNRTCIALRDALASNDEAAITAAKAAARAYLSKKFFRQMEEVNSLPVFKPFVPRLKNSRKHT